jgi:alanine racemase
MTRPIHATIHLAAFAHNLAVARRHAGAARVLAVLKADAYGHGLARVLPAARAADGLAVLDIEAAGCVRDAGFAGPVVLLEGCFDAGELREAVRLDLAPVIHAPDQLEEFMAARIERPIDVWLKLNSGMNRLGFRVPAFQAAMRRLDVPDRVRSLTLMTHFANADDGRGVAAQVALLETAAAGTAHPRSAANSAALLRHPEARGHWVRPGIVLYGATPFADVCARDLGLEPVMSLESRVIAVQSIAAGESVGYGWSFRAPQPMRIGVVACGYADGYPRHAPTGTPVAVAGTRTRTVGRVSMDMLCIDLTALPQAGVGTPVELWGGAVSVDEVAVLAGTVGYELLCALAPRVPVRVRTLEVPPG